MGHSHGRTWNLANNARRNCTLVRRCLSLATAFRTNADTFFFNPADVQNGSNFSNPFTSTVSNASLRTRAVAVAAAPAPSPAPAPAAAPAVRADSRLRRHCHRVFSSLNSAGGRAAPAPGPLIGGCENGGRRKTKLEKNIDPHVRTSPGPGVLRSDWSTLVAFDCCVVRRARCACAHTNTHTHAHTHMLLN